jgi:hypothetical protein
VVFSLVWRSDLLPPAITWTTGLSTPERNPKSRRIRWVPEFAGLGEDEPGRGISGRTCDVSGIGIAAAAAAAAAIGLSLAACGGGNTAHVSGYGSTTSAASTRAPAAPSATTLRPESGYRGREDFCAGGPLSGHVLYDGAAGQLVPSVLTVAVAGLFPDTLVYVDWSNDHIRGYIIGSFKTDSAGKPIPSSVSMGRLAEVRGVEMVLESVSIPPTVFGRLEPC